MTEIEKDQTQLKRKVQEIEVLYEIRKTLISNPALAGFG